MCLEINCIFNNNQMKFKITEIAWIDYEINFNQTSPSFYTQRKKWQKAVWESVSVAI